MAAVSAVAAESSPAATASDVANSLSHTPRGKKTAAANPRPAPRVQPPQEAHAPSTSVAWSSNHSGLMPGADPVVTATGFTRSVGSTHERQHAREAAPKAATSAPAKANVIAGAQPIVPASSFATSVR
jgi:hypothetical protein